VDAASGDEDPRPVHAGFVGSRGPGLSPGRCGLGGSASQADNQPEAIALPWPVRLLRFGFLETPRDIFWALLGGFVLSGAIAALLPDDFFARSFGSEALAILVMLAVGLPLYVCASASTPVAAAMILKGLSPGAALVFLLAGPATNVTTMLAVKQQLGWKALVAYLGAIATMSVAMGLALNGIYQVFLGGHWRMAMGALGEEVLPSWLTAGSMLALAATLAAAGAHKVKARLPHRGAGG
jgi:hypothetical protein